MSWEPVAFRTSRFTHGKPHTPFFYIAVYPSDGGQPKVPFRFLLLCTYRSRPLKHRAKYTVVAMDSWQSCMIRLPRVARKFEA